jgi:hypothetical protein
MATMNTKHTTAVGQSPNITGNVTVSVGNASAGTVYTTVLGAGGGGGYSNYGNITIGGGYQLAGGNQAANWVGTNVYGVTQQSAIKVTGDAEFSGDIKWKGRSLGDLLEKIEDRLAILVPDPVRLAKYEALKQAYDNYKILEALCVDADDKKA